MAHLLQKKRFSTHCLLIVLIGMASLLSQPLAAFNLDKARFFLIDYNSDGVKDILIYPPHHLMFLPGQRLNPIDFTPDAIILLGQDNGHFIEQKLRAGQIDLSRWRESHIISEKVIDGVVRLDFFDHNGELNSLLMMNFAGHIVIEYLATPSFGANPVPKPASNPPRLSLSPANQQSAAINGKFRVNEQGQATYQIPVDVPAGVAGVKPSISLNYNSSGGDGVLGHGWGLSLGVPQSIVRCPKTRLQDGEGKALQYNHEDRLCVGGQRLVPADKDYSNYWADGKVLMPEMGGADFITLHYQSGLLTFVVARKDGSKHHYGHNESWNDKNAQVTVAWRLTRTEDNLGNAITFHYQRLSGILLIESVRYAYQGNQALAEVNFEYEAKAFVRKGFNRQGEYRTDKRLARIKTQHSLSAGGAKQALKEYRLNYKNLQRDPSTAGHNLSIAGDYIESISVCADGHCLQDTRFSTNTAYNRRFRPFATAYGRNAGISTEAKMNGKAGDINGDGRQDIIIQKGYVDWSGGDPYRLTLSVLYAQPNGGLGQEQNLSPGSFLYSPHAYAAWEVIDFNQDGYSDLIRSHGNNWVVHISNGRTLNQGYIDTGIAHGGGDTNNHFIDINNDGLVDIVSSNCGRMTVAYLKKVGDRYQFQAPQDLKIQIDEVRDGKFYLEVRGKLHPRVSRCNYKGHAYSGQSKPSGLSAGAETKWHLENKSPYYDSVYAAYIHKLASVIYTQGSLINPSNYYSRDLYVYMPPSAYTPTSNALEAYIQSKYTGNDVNLSLLEFKDLGQTLRDFNNDGIVDLLVKRRDIPIEKGNKVYQVSTKAERYPDKTQRCCWTLYQGNINANGEVYFTASNQRLSSIKSNAGTSDRPQLRHFTEGSDEEDVYDEPLYLYRTQYLPDEDPSTIRLTSDFNQDGYTDIVFSNNNIVYGGPNGFSAPQAMPGVDWRNVHLFDVNRDGYNDIISSTTSNASHAPNVSLYNPRTSNFDPAFNGAEIGLSHEVAYYFFHEDYHLVNADVDGDSFAELVALNVYCANRDAGDRGKNACKGRKIHPYGTVFRDNNGMGNWRIYKLVDYPTQAEFQASSSATNTKTPNKPLGRVTAIDNGLGVKTRIHYESLATTSAYSIDTALGLFHPGAIHPGIKVPGAVFLIKKPNGHVVTRTTSSVPNAGAAPDSLLSSPTRSINYRYGNLRAQAGVGQLGYRYLSSQIDDGQSPEVRTYYRQDYPFIGRAEITTSSHERPKYTSFRVDVDRPWYFYIASPGQLSATNPLISSKITRTQLLTEAGADPSAWQTPAQRKVIYESEITERDYSWFAGNQIYTKESRISNQVDRWHNLLRTERKVRINGQLLSSEETNNLYGSSEEAQQLGRLSRSVSRKTRQGQEPVINITDYQYYSSGRHRNMLEYAWLDKGSALELQTHYQYDYWGNRIRETHRGDAGGKKQTRYSLSEYEPTGRFVKATYAFDGYKELLQSQVLSRNKSGLATHTRNALGVETGSQYNVFGQPVQQWSNTGDWQRTLTYRAADFAEPGIALRRGVELVIKTESASGALSYTQVDGLGHTLREMQRNFKGDDWIITDSDYNARGRLAYQTKPYYQSCGQNCSEQANAKRWNHYQYDVYGRPTYARDVLGNETRINYSSQAYRSPLDNLSTQVLVTQTVLNNTRTQVSAIDGRGNTLYVIDEQGNRVDSSYTSHNKLRQSRSLDVKTNQTLVTEISYNARGLKVGLKDPNKGQWTYRYNAFDEMIGQSDSEGNTQRIYYNALGNKIAHYSHQKGKKLGSKTLWHYARQDEQRIKAGQLSRIEHHDNEIQDQKGTHEVDFHYDELGRLSLKITNMDDYRLEERTTYDALGRVHQQFDASGRNRGIEYHYNAQGYLSSLKEAALKHGQAQTTYISYQNSNALGGSTEASLGNAYQLRQSYDQGGRLSRINAYRLSSQATRLDYRWDQYGNLLSRHDTSGGRNQQEAFCYDTLNRLSGWNPGSLSNSTCSQQYQYDGLGNLTQKAYRGQTLKYRYNAQNKPHALARVDISAKEYDTFSYNANGDALEHRQFKQQQQLLKRFSYNSRGQVTHIQLSQGSTSHSKLFWHNASQQRYKHIDEASGDTTYYLGNVEIIKHRDGRHTVRRTIANIAQSSFSVGEVGEESDEHIDYYINDSLGSRHTLMSEKGQIHYMSFDPWGNRRSVNDISNTWQQGSLNNTPGISQLIAPLRNITPRGYTGHEMLDSIGLIHMNARLYDPRLSRFLQGDTIIAKPKFIQAYNRYSYVYNNPLNKTDPSGNIAAETAVYIAAMVVAAAMPAIQDGAMRNQYPAWVVTVAQVFSCYYGGANSCALAAGTQAYHNSDGSFGETFKAVVMSYGQSAISYRIGSLKAAGSVNRWGAAVLHGISAGTFAELRGGKFGHGFISAGITSALGESILGIENDFLEAAASSLLGGTVSELTGGKFANGAISALIVWKFNDNAHAPQERSQNPFEIIRKLFPGWFKQEVSDPAGKVLGNLAVSAKENLKFGTTTKAAIGSGVGASSTFTVDGIANSESIITVDYVRGAIIEGGIFIRGDVYSAGKIDGFYQSGEVCMIGCIRGAWDYHGNFNVGTRIVFPFAFGGSISGGYTTSGAQLLKNITGQ